MLTYVGSRSISKYGCSGCHDIPGYEGAKPIGTTLADWGRKETSKLAFEHILHYVEHKYAHDEHGHPADDADDHGGDGHGGGEHAAGEHARGAAGDEDSAPFAVTRLAGRMLQVIQIRTWRESEDDLAALLAYLRQQGDAPPPLD